MHVHIHINAFVDAHIIEVISENLRFIQLWTTRQNKITKMSTNNIDFDF